MSTIQDDDRMHYVTAAANLEPGDRAVIECAGREIGVFNVDGTFHAVGNYCPHMGGPCAEGLVTGMFDADAEGNVTFERDGEILCCPWHGWQFDIDTGDHLGHSKKRLLTFDTVVEDGDVYVRV